MLTIFTSSKVGGFLTPEHQMSDEMLAKTGILGIQEREKTAIKNGMHFSISVLWVVLLLYEL